MIPKLLKRLVLSALLTGVAGGAALAHTPSDPAAVKDLGKLTSLSNLVVQTKVTKVTYKVSSAGANGAKPMPYTFVTFSVAGVIAGASPGASLTLKFLGGPDGQGGFLSAEGVPTFQVGDQDILFVVSNGAASGCALVMCEFGRFRVYNNAVYGTHGEPVLSLTAGKLTLGAGYGPDQFHSISYPTPSFDEMMKNPAFAAAVSGGGNNKSLSAMRSQYAAQAPKSIVIDERDSAGIDGPINGAAQAVAGVSVQQFVSSLGAAAAANATASLGTVQSASPSASLVVPGDVPAAPPASSN